MSIDKLATDEQECLVMFNRAVEYNDSVAWQFLHQRFRGMMRHWLQQYLVGYGKRSRECCRTSVNSAPHICSSAAISNPGRLCSSTLTNFTMCKHYTG